MSILSFYHSVDHSFTLQAFINRMNSEERISNKEIGDTLASNMGGEKGARR